MQMLITTLTFYMGTLGTWYGQDGHKISGTFWFKDGKIARCHGQTSLPIENGACGRITINRESLPKELKDVRLTCVSEGNRALVSLSCDQ